jgi:aminoglycoside phosphotransferase (APT) family kinase protein
MMGVTVILDDQGSRLMATRSGPSNSAPPTIPAACRAALSLTPVRYLGGRLNQHWLVESDGKLFVLRGYVREPIESVEYEREVLRRLGQQGWPVPKPVREPVALLGRLWCLFTLLPGESRSERTADERRARGRLLARLHEATASLVDIGQRKGFRKADEVVRDPQLLEAIQKYERVRPAAGHVMRWHLDKTCEMFDGLVLDRVETIVLHGDFAPWNMLFVDERLSGIIDFEAAHLNYRVSDFALSWRGYQDDVIEGYEQVRALNELDWQLLIPCYWSWLFLGVQEKISSMIEGNAPYHDFDWQNQASDRAVEDQPRCHVSGDVGSGRS